MTSQQPAGPERGGPATASGARPATAVAPAPAGGARAGAPASQPSPETFGRELDRAVRKERHVALRMLIALAIVALVVCARLLFFG